MEDFGRLNKKISVVRVAGLKIVGRVGTHIIFSGKKYNLIHFERHFKMHKIIFFPRKPEKILCSTSKFR